MRSVVATGLVLALCAAACAPKAEKVALKEGMPAFQLAKDVSAVVPALAPDKETVLVRAKGIEITAAEVLLAIQDNIGKRAAQLAGMDAVQLKQIIERSAVQIAERKLLLRAAARAKTAVSPEELDAALKAEYGRAGSEQNFLDALKAESISLEHVKKSVGETLLINKYLNAIVAGAGPVTEETLRKAYEESKTRDKTASVRHILLLTEGKSEPEKAEIRKKIDGLLVRAKAGEDFAALAKQYSEDPGSKDNGGLYENFPRGQMVKPFDDAAFAVPVGEISGIVETNFGYHILKVEDRKKETRPFEEVRAELESQLKGKGRDQVLQAHIQGLKDKAGLKTFAL